RDGHHLEVAARGRRYADEPGRGSGEGAGREGEPEDAYSEQGQGRAAEAGRQALSTANGGSPPASSVCSPERRGDRLDQLAHPIVREVERRLAGRRLDRRRRALAQQVLGHAAVAAL